MDFLLIIMIIIKFLFFNLDNNEDRLTNPDLCYENAARFKRLIDAIQYNGPMTDNTKLKSGFHYSTQFGCIIGSSLQQEETQVNSYDDISVIIDNIKERKAIAKEVRAYLLQVRTFI